MSMHPTGIHETILYGEDLDAMERFYREVVGLRMVSRVEERSRGFRVSASQVLLVFRASVTGLGHPMVPTHGATGEGHVAFTIERGTYEAWRGRLEGAGVAIEREVKWEPLDGVERGRSLYVRDPAGNSVEFIEGEVWPA
ncbi:MAG: VOC family protein [Phycisphaeraceae bacterium]|nr:MAG: VOC family protein [Phycisphaeraceae bacterium]